MVSVAPSDEKESWSTSSKDREQVSKSQRTYQRSLSLCDRNDHEYVIRNWQHVRYTSIDISVGWISNIQLRASSGASLVLQNHPQADSHNLRINSNRTAFIKNHSNTIVITASRLHDQLLSKASLPDKLFYLCFSSPRQALPFLFLRTEGF
jgi:hypothetical protein